MQSNQQLHLSNLINNGNLQHQNIAICALAIQESKCNCRAHVYEKLLYNNKMKQIYMFSNFQRNKQSHSYRISLIIKTNSISVQQYVITALAVEERNAMAKNTYVRITALVIINF